MSDTPRLISLLIDHGKKAGSGHLSRCRGLLEFLARDLGFRLELITDKDCLSRWPEWLRKLRVLPQLDKPRTIRCSQSLLVDSYCESISDLLRLRTSFRTVVVTDEEHQQGIGSENVFEVRVERFDYSQDSARGTPNRQFYLCGSIIWNSALEEVASRRTRLPPFPIERSIALSLGGSDNVSLEISHVLASFQESQLPHHLSVHSADNAVEGVRDVFRQQENIEFFPLGDEYYQKLSTCDFLVCHAGTSAVEAYHLGIPAIVLNLFPNAYGNFVSLRARWHQALFLDTVEELTDKVLRDFALQNSKPEMAGGSQRERVISKSELAHIRDFFRAN